MKKIITVLVLVATIFSCKDGKQGKKFDNNSYESAKETLADKEKNNPARFISVDSRDHKNIIGQTVVKGTLTNNASVCWYKDVELHLSFYSKTGVKLDEGLETVYENIPPGKTVRFKTKYFAPKGTDSVSVTVTKATGDITISKK